MYKPYEVCMLGRSGDWIVYPVMVMTVQELMRWVDLELMKMDAREVWVREKRGGGNWGEWRDLLQ